MRYLVLVFWLVAGVAWGQTPAQLPYITPNGNASNTTVTISGGTARTLTNIIGADSTNILDVLPQASSSTDYTSAINNALLKAPTPVYLPNTGTSYQISGTLTFPAGAQLYCEPNTVINVTGSISGSVIAVSGSNAGITNCFFQGNSINVELAVISSDHFFWLNGGWDHAGTVYFSGSGAQYGTFQNVKVTNDFGTGIDCQQNSIHCDVLNSEFENEVGFGIRADTGSSDFLFQGNWTDGNSVELIGITYQGHDGRIIGNRAEGTGDNGISVSGYNNVVADNIAYRDAFTGIYVYGDSNVVTGNDARDNGQVHNPSSPFYNAGNALNYSGLEVNGNYGGAGQNNNVTGNTGDDDQSTMTQAYDLNIGGGYANWSASTVYFAGAYVYSNDNTYQTLAGGTSGATAPSCTSGTCSDGSVTWTYLETTPMATREPAQNMFAGNHLYRALVQPFIDSTINHSNAVYADNFFNENGTNSAVSPIGNSIVGNINQKVGTNWSSGMSTTYGELVYVNNGSHLYRALNAGTSTVQPTHTSGTVTESDSVMWLYLTSGAYYSSITLNQQNAGPGNYLALPVEESTSSYCPVFAGIGSPQNKVTASPCALYVNSSGGSATTLWVKESGTATNTGWVGK